MGSLDRSGAIRALEQCESALARMTELSPAELRLLRERLRTAAAACSDAGGRRRVERLAEQAREELVRRISRERDTAVEEARARLERGETGSARERLESFRRDHPAMADHATVHEVLADVREAVQEAESGEAGPGLAASRRTASCAWPGHGWNGWRRSWTWGTRVHAGPR